MHRVTPIVHIVQTFLNEDDLYHALVDLPEKMNFFAAIKALVYHPKFSLLQSNVYLDALCMPVDTKYINWMRFICFSIYWQSDDASEYEWVTNKWRIRYQ